MSDLDDLIADVAQRCGVSPDAICGPARHPRAVAARRLVWFVLRRLNWRWTDIGRATHRDHATVQNTLQRYVQTIDAWTQTQIDALLAAHQHLLRTLHSPRTPEQIKEQRRIGMQDARTDPAYREREYQHKLARERDRYANDPAYRARRLAGNRAYKQRHKTDPAYRDRKRAYHRDYQRRRADADPTFRAYQRQKKRESYQRQHPDPNPRGRPTTPRPTPETPPARHQETAMPRPRPRAYNHIASAANQTHRAQPAARAALTAQPVETPNDPIRFDDLTPIQQHEVEAQFLRLCAEMTDPATRLAEAGRRVLGRTVVL